MSMPSTAVGAAMEGAGGAGSGLLSNAFQPYHVQSSQHTDHWVTIQTSGLIA